MTEDKTYKVLWVEDDISIIDSYQRIAEGFGIDLEVATNWEAAEEMLRANFNEYSAIILDAMCKIKKSDSTPSKLFLGHVSVRLSRIMGEKHKFIPWYVLSAGTMDHFGIVLEFINTEERKSMDPLWGPMKYIKGGDNEDELFRKIYEIASDTEINKVLFRHSDVFKYLGKEDFIDYNMARTSMLKMLSAMYNPEENLNFVYDGNPLRKVAEYLFRTANKKGLLPDDCLENRGNEGVNLIDASRFMSGLNPYYCKYRYGNAGDGKDGKGGDAIFSEDICQTMRQVLNFTNADSHTKEDDPYTINEDKKEIFFGFVLQLCQVIKDFGRFLESHPDRTMNTKMFTLKPGPIETKDNWKNNNFTTPSKLSKPTVVFPKKEITSEDLIGKTKVIICLKPGCIIWGDNCLVPSKYKNYIGHSAILKAVKETTDGNSEYKYEAIELEIIE